MSTVLEKPGVGRSRETAGPRGASLQSQLSRGKEWEEHKFLVLHAEIWSKCWRAGHSTGSALDPTACQELTLWGPEVHGGHGATAQTLLVQGSLLEIRNLQCLLRASPFRSPALTQDL